MVDVFISYSRRDQTKVAILARAIAEEGYEVWWDAELPPHLSYGDVITEKIAIANAALVVWSENSVQSEWVRAEADMARNQRKLIQTSLDEVMPPLPFNQIQYAAIGDWQGEADHTGWRKVKASLADLCGPRSGSEQVGGGGGRGPEPVPPLQSPPALTPAPAPAAAPSTSMWPLFAGIGVAGVVLIGVVAFWFGQRDTVKVEPAPATAALQAAADEGGDIAVAAPEPRREIAASRFDLLATVADPDGYSNIRDAPSITGRILGRVLVGKAFATYNQRGKWWQVRLPDGTIGYIARSRIRLSGESGAAGAGSGAKRDHGGEVQGVDPSDLIFPDSSTRLLVYSDLDQFGPSTLRIARNEIYARKGRRFKDSSLRNHFSQFSWYRPRRDDVTLNRVERQNVATILAAEAHFQ